MDAIFLNSSNVVSYSNNTQFIYQFPQSVNFTGKQICLAKASLYYSWFNITSALQNNSVSYTWVDGKTFNIVIPDGCYSISDLNLYILSIAYSNSHYLLDSNGGIISLFNISVNQTFYATQIDTYCISKSIATTNEWTLPDGANWVIPDTPNAPVINITTPGFAKYIGFNVGNYGGSAFNSSFLSQNIPQISQVSSLFFHCSIANNSVSSSSQLIACQPMGGVSYGNILSYDPYEFIWTDAIGIHNTLTIRITDQNLNSISIRDPDMMFMILIRDKNKN